MSYIIAAILLFITIAYILIDAFKAPEAKRKKRRKRKTPKNNVIEFNKGKYINSCWEEIEKH